MDVKELKEVLADLPDHVKVYREADHGQKPEASPGIQVTRDTELPYYGDDIDWFYIDNFPVGEVTAILIG